MRPPPPPPALFAGVAGASPLPVSLGARARAGCVVSFLLGPAEVSRSFETSYNLFVSEISLVMLKCQVI